MPFAPLWAILGGLLQIIPTFGGMIALIGPVLAVAFSGHDEWRLGLVLGLYGVIVILEGLVIGPYVLHRTTKVPWWAAFFGPIVLGIIIPFWGVLLAPPLLAIVFAFRKPKIQGSGISQKQRAIVRLSLRVCSGFRRGGRGGARRGG